jgi:hypothetical protein
MAPSWKLRVSAFEPKPKKHLNVMLNKTLPSLVFLYSNDVKLSTVGKILKAFPTKYFSKWDAICPAREKLPM